MTSNVDLNGKAALMLVESLLLLLIEKRVLMKRELVDAIDELVETDREAADEGGHAAASMTLNGVLRAISTSLSAASTTDDH
jgi:hypothetical protein